MGDIADLLNATYFDEMDNIDAVGNACFRVTKLSLGNYHNIKSIGPGMCPRCKGPTLLKTGIHGKFYGCCKFPDCKGSRYYK